MSNSISPAAIRFYFSFRSPYSWLATEQLGQILGDLNVAIERIPIYPTPGLFQNDPAAIPQKVDYLVQDIRRLARERGLTVRFPAPDDPDWSIPHAAFLTLKHSAMEHAFMVEMFRKRFAEGLDISDDGVIADAAARAGLDPQMILRAAHDDGFRTEAAQGFRLGVERDGIFGVPSFVYAGKLYWGQDRMHFLRSAVLRKGARSSSWPDDQSGGDG